MSDLAYPSFHSSSLISSPVMLNQLMSRMSWPWMGRPWKKSRRCRPRARWKIDAPCITVLSTSKNAAALGSGGVTIATLRHLAESGVIRPEERVVAYVTGHGLKTLEALTATVGPTATIAPTIEAFMSAFSIDEE